MAFIIVQTMFNSDSLIFRLSAKFSPSPTHQSFIDGLTKDKNGIYITGETSIQEVRVGHERKLTLWVQNKGTSPQILKKCHIPADGSQFAVGSVKFLREHQAMMARGNADVTEGSVTIFPAMSVYINLTFNAR